MLFYKLVYKYLQCCRNCLLLHFSKGSNFIGDKEEDNILSEITEFPKIGERIERFIDIFGTPGKGSGGQSYYFEINGIKSRLLCEVIGGQVYNISWALPFTVDKVRDIATRFLPQEAFLIREGVIEVNPILKEDVPMKDDYYRLQDTDEDLFFAVGEDSTFNIHLEINQNKKHN